MANPSKQKGTAAETSVARFLNDHGWPAAERRTLSGAKDKGDIAGLRSVVIEVKDCKTMTLGPWLKEAVAEMFNAKADIAAVWHKRRGTTNPAEWFVTMTGGDFVQLLKEAGR